MFLVSCIGVSSLFRNMVSVLYGINNMPLPFKALVVNGILVCETFL